MDNISYLAAFMGGCISIGTFSMGASLIGVLNFTQAVVAMAIGCLVIGIALVLNGSAGHKYGIPYTGQARGAFGTGGVEMTGHPQRSSAIVWFGFQSGRCRTLNLSMKPYSG
jgi:NCS1 family nucleobase:cation symporter-1